MSQRAWVVVLLLAWVAGCEARAKTRYVMAVDPGSRYGFRHVMERESKLWVHLHCELRVPVARRLPDPITTPETGDLMSTTYFGSDSMGSGNFVPRESTLREGYRVWLARSLAQEDDYTDASRYGVVLKFPTGEPGPPPSDPMELFELPRFESLVPYVWSPWERAIELRNDPMAEWAVIQGEDAPTPPPAPHPHPFEMRCRTVLWDQLYTPIEAEDPNVGKPDPSAL